jgi:hypothetical protein
LVLLFAFEADFAAVFRLGAAFDFVLVLDLAVDFVFALAFVAVFDFALVVDFAFVFAFDFDFDLAFDLAGDVFREVVFRADEPRRVVDLLDPPSSSPSSELISFFATPTAAGIATPSAVPATTFCLVDRPSSSSAMSLLRYLASSNASMNFGMSRSRKISGPCVATYLPADSAASSAMGRSTSDAASQLVAAAEAISPDPALFVLPTPLPFELPLWSCESAFLTAYVAAVVAAAAAAAVSTCLLDAPVTLS